MASAIEYRPFRSGDWPDLRRFYEAVYGRGYVLTQRKFFDWNFFSPIRVKGPTLTVAVCEGGIVGSCGALPWRIQVDGSEERAVYNVNLFLDPAFRGQGVGQRLLASVSEDATYSLSVGAAEASVSMYGKIGATYRRDVDRFIRVLNFDEFTSFLGASTASMANGAFSKALRCHQESQPFLKTQDRRVTPVTRFDVTWDASWERMRARYGLTTWRDCTFLNWRYVDYPFPLYECFVSSHDGRISGLLVTRTESPALGKVLRVIDLVGESDDDEIALLAHAEQLARSSGCVFLDFAVFRSEPAVLEKLGFLHFAGGTDAFELIPLDLNPVRVRRGVIFLATRVASEWLPDSVIAGDVYVVKGDGDFDRAN